MSKKKWWERFDSKWVKVKYSDEPHRFFWTRDCGLLVLDVEPKGRWLYLIGASALDGSVDNSWHEEFKGSPKAAKEYALTLGYHIVCEIAKRLK